MLAAGSNKRMNKQGAKKWCGATLDKESPIQAVCPNWARTDLCGGREVNSRPYRENDGPTAKVALLTDPSRTSPQLKLLAAFSGLCFDNPVGCHRRGAPSRG
jgi:hypothetical protein